MQYADNRELHEKMFRAYSMRGNNNNANDNKQVILDLMKLRIEKASLLGYNTPVDFLMNMGKSRTTFFYRFVSYVFNGHAFVPPLCAFIR